MSTINWADLQKTADEATRPLPDGMYPVEVEKATATDSSKGNPMIKLELRIYDGPGTGRKMFTQLTLSTDNPMALAFFFRNLGAFGIDASVLATQPSMDTLATLLVSRKATADINTRPWQGVDRNNVKAFAVAAPGTIQPTVQAPLGGGIGAASALGGMAAATPLGGMATAAPIGTPAAGVVPGPISVAPTVTTAPAVVPTDVAVTDAVPAVDKKDIPSF